MDSRASLPRLTILAVLLLLAGGNARGADPFVEKSLQPFLSKNCYGCHTGAKPSGDFDLAKLADGGSIELRRDAWELVLDKLQKGEMPPPKKPRPDAQDLKAVTSWLTAEFDRLDKSASPNPGRVSARRLNRTEYNNTVRDLLGVDIHPADDFPPDDSGYGFDNNGDVLSMSPMLMEKYVKAAENVARTALFGVLPMQATSYTHEPWYIDFDTTKAVKFDYDETGMSMPYALHVIHRFPVEADYELTGWVRGFRPGGSDPVKLAFWIDGKLIHEGQVPVPADGEMNGLFDKFRTHVTAGDHWMSISILKIYEGLPKAYKGPNPNQSMARVFKSPTEFFVQNLKVVGPFDQVKGPSSESMKLIYTCGHLDGHHDADCSRKILSDLARRAFRRPVTQEEVDDLVGLVDMVQKEGDSFEEGLCVAIQKILISPYFLFRIEKNPTGNEAAAVNPHELATRLSYFLWSTMPDAELFQCADDGSLGKQEVLEAQVRRMLKDPRSHALAENFGGQWLQYRALESHTLERKKFQQYTEYTRMSMQEETERFFDYIVHEDRSVLDFIDGNYSFLNQRLAEFYGIPGVKGHEFRRVELPPESHRGGVLTQASVLTVSSYANRTSPVIRGKWVLENMLNAPPPPPPANVPSLKDEVIGSTASMREQLSKHRENVTCASCHARMDPLGFGLENFDAIGAWRDVDGKIAIDSSGDLPDGRSFNGPDELKIILKSDKEAFASCLADKMLTYALGRGTTSADRATVKAIAGQEAKDDYRFSSLVLGIVNSAPFRMRTGS
jgi:hypothetical protein